MIAARTSKRLSRGAGLTLPEVLIAGTLLLLVLAVSAELTRMAYNTFRKSTDSTKVFQQQTVATDLLNRELRLCTAVLEPRDPKIYERPYSLDGRNKLVFRRFSPSLKRETVVSYRLDRQRGELIRETYQPDYDPRRPSSQVLSTSRSPRVVATKVQSFEFTTEHPDKHYGAFFATFRLQVKVGEAVSTVESSVRVRAL